MPDQNWNWQATAIFLLESIPFEMLGLLRGSEIFYMSSVFTITSTNENMDLNFLEVLCATYFKQQKIIQNFHYPSIFTSLLTLFSPT